MTGGPLNGWRVRGYPTDAELAAVVAAVEALRASPVAAVSEPRWRDGWGGPSALLRPPIPSPYDDPEETR